MATLAPAKAPSGRGLRPWLLRAALALGAPAALLLALEGGLRVLGVGRPATFLIADDRPGFLRTNPEFAGLFLPGEFDLRPLNFRVAARKPPNTVRIVVLGESAAQGVPVPSFAFGPQLRAQLRARFPGRDIEVLDTGIVAINSHVVYQIAREMARYEPDLFVVYAGNNEVVGPYGPGCAYLSRMPPLWLIRASVFIRSTRTGQLAGALAGRLAGRAAPAEWGGMSMFVNSAVAGDDPRLAQVYRNFEANLDGIVDAASGAGAKAILCTVVANLKDCPPFLSIHGPGPSGRDLAAWTAAFESGRLAWRLGDPSARARLEEALRLDPQYAETHYMLGLLDLSSGDGASARRHLVDALHWDALRFRPDPEINAVIRRVAARHGAALVDSAAALGSDPASTAAPSGRELLFEHVHFDWPGNYRMALLMAGACASALGGSGGDAAPFLGEDACAAALGYTGHERLPMLMGIDVLVRKPPFTNQLTYVRDQARLASQIEAARAASGDRAVTDAAERTARRALAADPDNPALAGILEGICNATGNRGEALDLARRAERLLPADYALRADEASILVGLGRYAEAEAILRSASETGADLDLLAPVYGELWARSGRFGEGLRFLGSAIARRPDDRRLRLARAELLRGSGDPAGAERELRQALARHPADEDALEALVRVLAGQGRPGEAAQAGLAAADSQPMNQANNLRAATACGDAGDAVREVTYLEAAERSGPVNTTFELTLALKLYKQARRGEAMERLAEALALSGSEGNPDLTGSIRALIGRLAGQAQPGGREAP